MITQVIHYKDAASYKHENDSFRKTSYSKELKPTKLKSCIKSVLKKTSKLCCAGCNKNDDDDQMKDSSPLIQCINSDNELNCTVQLTRMNADLQNTLNSTGGTDIAHELCSNDLRDSVELQFDAFSFGLMPPPSFNTCKNHKECKFFPDPVLVIYPFNKTDVSDISNTVEKMSRSRFMSLDTILTNSLIGDSGEKTIFKKSFMSALTGEKSDVTENNTIFTTERRTAPQRAPSSKSNSKSVSIQSDVGEETITSHIVVNNQIHPNNSSFINVSVHYGDNLAATLEKETDICEESLKLTINNTRKNSGQQNISVLSAINNNKNGLCISNISAVEYHTEISNSITVKQKTDKCEKQAAKTDSKRPSVVLLSNPMKFNKDLPSWIVGSQTEKILLGRLACGKWETVISESQPLDPMLKEFGINYFKRLFMDRIAVPLTITFDEKRTKLNVIVHTPIGNRHMIWGLDGLETQDNDPDCGLWRGTMAIDYFSHDKINSNQQFRVLHQKRIHDNIGIVHERCAVMPHAHYGKIFLLHYTFFKHNQAAPFTSALRILRPIAS